MSNHTTTNLQRREYTAPLPTCPEWCNEHYSATIDDGEDAPPRLTARTLGETFSQHRRIVYRHVWPAQRHSWPNGVRTLTVEQSAFDEKWLSAHTELTLWPGKKEETTQSLNVHDLRDLIAAAAKAIEIIEAAQR